MSIRRAILASTLALSALALGAPSANARATREVLTSFGSVEESGGLALDQETGNVYVTDNKTQTVYIFGPTGGAPAGGVPSQITGMHITEKVNTSDVAIDNSCYEHQPRLTGLACEEYDPSYGDVYVMDDEEPRADSIEKLKLNPGHGYEPVERFGHGDGVTVDSRGDIYVLEDGEPRYLNEFKKNVKKVVNGGNTEIVEELEEISFPGSSIARLPNYVAVDDFGDIYVASEFEDGGPSEGFHGVAKLKVGAAGNLISEEVFAGSLLGVFRPVAVDPATGVVYVGDGPEIAEYDSAGALQLEFGSAEPLGGSLGTGLNGVVGLAVNGETERVYVANRLHHDIEVFGPVIGPPVFEAAQPAASSVAQTSAEIAGTVDPESDLANYYFQYVADAEYEPASAEPYRDGGRTATVALTGGRTPETVERVALTGLQPGTGYHYRMVVSNSSAISYGPDETFTTAAATPPTVGTGPAGEVSATGATLTGVVGPQGLPTSYVFEVGTDTSYGGAKLYGDAGSSTGEVPVTVALQYLAPGTTYHYRLVATSFDGTSYGLDGAFTTPSASAPVPQPPGAPLIAGPVAHFPSIAGAITEPGGVAKPKKVRAGARRLARALRACKQQRSGRRRVTCEARARRLYARPMKTNRSTKG
jgi:hypothetical protein